MQYRIDVVQSDWDSSKEPAASDSVSVKIGLSPYMYMYIYMYICANTCINIDQALFIGLKHPLDVEDDEETLVNGWWMDPQCECEVPWSGLQRRLVELTKGCYGEGDCSNPHVLGIPTISF